MLVIHDLNTALLKNISLTFYVGPLIGKCTETFKNRTVYLNYFVLMKVYSANANTKKGEPKYIYVLSIGADLVIAIIESRSMLSFHCYHHLPYSVSDTIIEDSTAIFSIIKT